MSDTTLDVTKYTGSVTCGQRERFGGKSYMCRRLATHGHTKLGYYLCADHAMMALMGLSDGLERLPEVPEGLSSFGGAGDATK